MQPVMTKADSENSAVIDSDMRHVAVPIEEQCTTIGLHTD
jgi:hypothetical protein